MRVIQRALEHDVALMVLLRVLMARDSKPRNAVRLALHQSPPERAAEAPRRARPRCLTRTPDELTNPTTKT
jgi:hypothetical protein